MLQQKRLNILWILALVLAAMVVTERVAAAGPTDLVLQVIEKSAALQSQPTANAPALKTLGVGARMTWSGQLQQAAGRNWLQVTTADGVFWTAPDSETLFLADPSDITPGMDLAAKFKPVDHAL